MPDPEVTPAPDPSSALMSKTAGKPEKMHDHPIQADLMFITRQWSPSCQFLLQVLLHPSGPKVGADSDGVELV
jgi:hypothetical protein